MILHGRNQLPVHGTNPDHDLAAARAELDRVVEQIDEHLPKACLVAPGARQPVRDVDAQRHALPLREEAQPFGRGRCQPAEIEVVDEREARAALDPREIHDLADHLDEVAGLDLDLGDPVAHLRRDRLAGRVGVAAEGLGQQADSRQRRPQLVRQVVDELGPDLLKPAELADVREHEPHAARRRTPGADEQRRAVGAAQADLAGRVALVEGRPGERLDLRIEEHLQEVEAQQHPWRPIDERMRRGVRVDDFQPGSRSTTATSTRSARNWRSLRLIGQVAFEPGVVRPELLDAVDRVALGPDPRQRSHPPQGDVRPAMRDECDDEPDRQRDRDDGPGIHGPSIAYGAGPCAAQRRRCTEGCRRRSSVSSDRHGRVSRSHSAAG